MVPPRELDEIEEQEFDFYEELMQEPSHGHNHGREKGIGGGWHPLETDPHDVPSFKRYAESPRKHGTAYTYVKLRCRCPVCQAWQRERIREYRARSNPSV